MKTQLLQDIDESHSYPGSAPNPARPAPAADTVAPPAAAPAPPVQPPPEPKPMPKEAAHVWRRPEPEREPEPVPPPPPPPPQPPQAAAPRPIMVEPIFIPDQGSAKEAHWVDRWGRQAGTLTACAIGAVLLAGIGYWYHRESKIDDTMAIVATSSASVRSTVPAQASPPAAVPSAPVAAEAPLPPMVLLEQPAAVPAPAVAKAEPDPVKPEPEPEPVLAKSEPAAEQPEPAVVKPKRQPVKKPAPVIAKAEPVKEQERPARPRPKPALPPAPKMTPAQVTAETLRQCRAAGYHAERCIERGCVLTKYGLACKG